MPTMTAGQLTAAAIRTEAAHLFASQGYAGTSLRDVAAKVGIKVGSLYNHISSKQELLLSVMGHTMDDLAERMQEAVGSRTDTLGKLTAFVELHIRFHAERAQEVFIGNSELRSLDDESRRQITEKRKRYRSQLEDLITKAGEEGSAEIINARVHTYSIVAMGTHVAGWYRPDGPMTMDEIVSTYTKITLRSLNVADADALVDSIINR